MYVDRKTLTGANLRQQSLRLELTTRFVHAMSNSSPAIVRRGGCTWSSMGGACGGVVGVYGEGRPSLPLNGRLSVQLIVQDLDVDRFRIHVVHFVLFIFLPVNGRSEELLEIFQRRRGRENEFVQQSADDSANDRTDPVNLRTTSNANYVN